MTMLELGLIEIRVLGLYCERGFEYGRFLSPSVPRVGERFGVMGHYFPIVAVEWDVINNKPLVDIRIDDKDHV